MPNDNRIIFLNGVSSAGKTSLSQALQACLDEPYLYIGLDDAYRMLPERYQDFTVPENVQHIRQAVSGVNRCIAGLASAGNNVLVDYVMTGLQTLYDCALLLAPFQVWFVAVNCELVELERRESARGRIGKRALARKQFDKVHAGKVYDFEVDTTQMSPEDCALLIKKHIESTPMPVAFEQIRNHITLQQINE